MRFLLEGCIELGLTAMIAIITIFTPPNTSDTDHTAGRRLSKNQIYFGDIFSNLCAGLTLLGLFVAPIYLYQVAKIYFKKHEDSDVKKKYGEMFKGFQVKTFPQLLYCLIFIIRRVTMVMVLTMLPTQRNIQINIFIITTLFVMSYASYVLPFDSMLQNIQETINEVYVLIASYHLFCFTEWVYDLNTRFIIGWSLIGVVIANLATNIDIIIGLTISQSIKKSRRAYYKRKYKKAIEAKNRLYKFTES